MPAVDNRLPGVFVSARIVVTWRDKTIAAQFTQGLMADAKFGTSSLNRKYTVRRAFRAYFYHYLQQRE